MNITSHMRLSTAMLFLIFAVQVLSQPSSPSTLESGRRSSSGAIQNASPQAVTQPTAQPAAGHINQEPTPNQSSIPCVASSPTEPKESFSQLTLFLFASGLGLFIALLGWSDQIRDKDTRELEHRFLGDTGIDERDFLRIVKPGSADEQLEALTQVVNDGQVKTKVSVEVLRTFANYISHWSRLERLSAWKYNLTIALTIALFVAGIASLFTTPTQQVRLAIISVRAEMLILILPMTLISLLVVIIPYSVQREKAFYLIRLHSGRASGEGEEVAMARKLPPDAREPLEGFFADIFVKVMNGMVKADSVEPEFGKIREAAKKVNTEQMRRIAGLAGKYYVEHANPSSKKLSREQVENLKREALEFALKTNGK